MSPVYSLLLMCRALAADPIAEDEFDASYLANTARSESAAAWYLAHLEDEPDRARFLASWLRAAASLPEQRSFALVEQVERWAAAHPDAEDAGVAVALAHSVAALPQGSVAYAFYRVGSWCDPALKALSTLPEGGKALYHVLRVRIEVAKACGSAFAEHEHKLVRHAMSGEAGPSIRAWYGAKDGVVDEQDLSYVRASLDEGWWTLSRLSGYALPGLAGPSSEEAQRVVIEQARALASSSRPAQIDAAIDVLEAAKLSEELHAARKRLAQLDPGNQSNLWALENPPKDDTGDEAPKEEEPTATSVIDPAERLAALRASGPPSGRWERATYFSARADAAGALGETRDELKSLARLRRSNFGSSSDQRFVEAALREGRKLRAARRAVTDVLEQLRHPYLYSLPTEERSLWSEDVAEALTLRAEIDLARDRRWEAADDLAEALLVGGPDASRLVKLGMLYGHEPEFASEAAPLLAAGLAGLPTDAAERPEATEMLEGILAKMKGWRPDLDAALAAARRQLPDPEAKAGAAETFDNALFKDLEIALPDGNKRLFDIEGPFVLDLWATWCGPCKLSLPHLDQLARDYEGRVTFIAASVDAERETANRYLERRGEPRFVNAWLGADGMSRVGISGIPAMFVFDEDHKLIARLSGYSPGSDALDEAVEAIFASP